MCGAYEEELLRIGRRTRVCKGCAFAASGMITGLLAGLASCPSLPTVLAVAAAGGAPVVVSLVRRLPKVVTRLVPAVLGGASLGGAAMLGGPLSVALFFALAASAGLVVAVYRRRGPDRSPCATCPERNEPAPCTGLRPILSRERAFRRVALRLLDARS